MSVAEHSPAASELPELQSALAAQRGPLAHVESAFNQGWSLIGDELAEARRTGAQPAEAWRQSFQFLKGLRGDSPSGQTPQTVADYQQALDLQDKGLARLADDPFSDHAQYLQRMGEHFRPQVDRMRQLQEQCLDASGAVGAQAMAPEASERLSEMDRTLTLLGGALSSVVGRGSAYLERLSGPAQEQQLAPAAPAQTAQAPSVQAAAVASPSLAVDAAMTPEREALLAQGPSDFSPQGLKAYYHAAYGVDLDFGPDGRPILPPIEGPVRGTMPQGVGLGLDLDLSH